ncbi:MAG: hypothetical protein SF339_12250 [Blastocatellia bacterium]|nr:hypothetical protein [Blastocatellia bacterium]
MSAQLFADEEIDVLFKTLDASEEPLTKSRLRQALPSGRFKLPESRITEILAELQRRELVFRFNPYGGKHERYWTRRLDEYARITLLAALAGSPVTRAELVKKTDGRLKDFPEDKRRAMLNELVKEGAVRKWPALIGGRSELFSTRAPDSRVYFQHVLASLRRKLDLSEDQLIADVAALLADLRARAADALPPPDPAQAILDAIARLAPPSSPGAVVSTRTLRQAVNEQFPEKAEFDRAVLELAAQEKLAVHYHDFPASLSPGELDELVTDGRGNFYIGVALRS